MASTLHTKQNTLNTLSNIGSAGQFLTNGANGTSYVTMKDSFQEKSDVLTIKNTPPSLEVKGNLVINGLDLEERLNTIERVLAIPQRDAIMEAKYPSLKKKFDEYINALEKYKTFERIKGDYE